MKFAFVDEPAGRGLAFSWTRSAYAGGVVYMYSRPFFSGEGLSATGGRPDDPHSTGSFVLCRI